MPSLLRLPTPPGPVLPQSSLSTTWLPSTTCCLVASRSCLSGPSQQAQLGRRGRKHSHHTSCGGRQCVPGSRWRPGHPRAAGAAEHTRLLGLGPRASLSPVSAPGALVSVRGKKTKTTVLVSDLPQGVIGPPSDADASEAPRPADQPWPAYPTVVQQARRNMQRFGGCVLLTRVGGFYELYFEQAEEYGPMLNLKVAQKKTSAGPVPMAGFPFFQLDRFLKVLVQDLNRHVAVAEEFPNSPADKVKSGGLMHDRRVARIITPGTLIDENFMDPYANNFVMAVHVGAAQDAEMPRPELPEVATDVPHVSQTTPVGLAWLDLSTGRFFTQSTQLASFSSILSRVTPRELILDEALQSRRGHGIASILAEDRYLVTYASRGEISCLSDWEPALESSIPAEDLPKFTSSEVSAGSLLLHYVKDRLQGLSMKLQPPLRHESLQAMTIDKNSMRALEIKQTVRDGHFRGSLLHAVRRTVTKSGARLLGDWLSSPSTSLDVIKSRQDLVEHFIGDEVLRDTIVLLLRRTHDSQRLVQKFALGRGDPDDLLGLAHTIRSTEQVAHLLRGKDTYAAPRASLESLAGRLTLEEPLALADHIFKAIDEDGLSHQHEIENTEAGEMMALAEEITSGEGSASDTASLQKTKRKAKMSIREYYNEDNDSWIMKPKASRNLKKLHAELDSLLEQRLRLGETLRESMGASSLTLRWTPGLGHICHVKGKDIKNLADVRSISASRSTRSFHHPDWTQLGQKLDQARFHIRAEEQRVFQQLREQVVQNIVKLRRNAAVLDELDITTSFAKLAAEQRLVRPILNDSKAHVIIGGRHPTVEGGLYEQGRSFMKNDCHVGSANQGRLWLITGPNMAGKSTFLRQNALITILAQVGCFVPADYADLGIVDAIFSRVGSADNLYRDQSTFMVEMLETAQILRDATPRSFVIMDEIGRGTTPEDGAAVSFAALHHLVTANQCRVLFATHFHEVVDLARTWGHHVEQGGSVEMYCTDVEEDDDGGFVYVHRLQKGVNRQSHALKVARLAGLPVAAIETAERVLKGQRGGTGMESVPKVTSTP